MATSIDVKRRDSGTGCVVELSHPLVKHHLAHLRHADTGSPEFRQLVSRLSVLLAYEATQGLALRPVEVETPLTKTTGHVVRDRIALVPILRAGLGMVDPILNLIPEAEVWHLGIYRDEKTMRPVEYYSKLPANSPTETAMIVDPMLATGGSAIAALSSLQQWGVTSTKVLSIIASRDGIAEVTAHFPDTEIYVCAIDPQLNQNKYIVPGLGDAGDRIFNTQRH